MGFLSRLAGSKPSPPSDTEPSNLDTASNSVLGDSSSASPPPGFAASGAQVDPGPKFHDPYAGISAKIKLNNGGFKLPEEPEFLFVEDTKKRRNVGENLCYYTGVGYLGGAIMGGVYGLTQLSANRANVQIESRRVQINQFLNTTGQAGRKSGNALGVLGLFFSAFESGITYFAEDYIPDGLATVTAGFATGALYRSPRGLLKAGYAGGVGATCATLLLFLIGDGFYWLGIPVNF